MSLKERMYEAIDGMMLEMLRELSDSKVLSCSVEEGLNILKGVKKEERVEEKDACVEEKKEKKEKKENKNKERKRSGMLLPYCGVVEESWCKGIRVNHGLYTQCENEMLKGCRYCKTCNKSVSKGSTGKPLYGDIVDREREDWRDEKGRKAQCYANVAKKRSLNIEDGKREAQRLGWTIRVEDLKERESKRGRPSKKNGSVGIGSVKGDIVEKLVEEAGEEMGVFVRNPYNGGDMISKEDMKKEDVMKTKIARVVEVLSSEEEIETDNKAETDKNADGKEEEEEEESITLSEEMIMTIEEVKYFKTSAFGLKAVLFAHPGGGVVGALDEATGAIQEIDFEGE